MTPDAPDPHRTGPPPIAILPDTLDDPHLVQRAQLLAQELQLPLADPAGPSEQGMRLAVTPRGLEMRLEGDRGGRPVRIDLTSLNTTSAAGRSRRQPIAKAVLIKTGTGRPPMVIDATAGFGQDTWLLASLGCAVTAVERSPVVAALLRDALARAGVTCPEIDARVDLIVGDACQVMQDINPQTPRPDVVYLDPMFPPRPKKTLERKSMRVLRAVVGADHDAGTLFEAAMAHAARRVVVKRPLHAEPLAPGPAVSHKGKGLRYDVYPVMKGGRGGL
jgi:16S rRNA (guanine1516-N2)-methyltransferase